MNVIFIFKMTEKSNKNIKMSNFGSQSVEKKKKISIIKLIKKKINVN